MVGSEHLARVIGHADDAKAKLVLVGDSERLGPIEAGGLFSAMGDRTERLEQMEPPSSEARREREIADQLLASRSAQALTAARIEPPAYIVK